MLYLLPLYAKIMNNDAYISLSTDASGDVPVSLI